MDHEREQACLWRMRSRHLPPQVQPFGSAMARSASPTRGGRAPSPLRAPSPGPPLPAQGLRAPPSPPQAPQGLSQGLQGPAREGRRSPAPGSRAPIQCPSECASHDIMNCSEHIICDA